jgi:hypothetical protein
MLNVSKRKVSGERIRHGPCDKTTQNKTAPKKKALALLYRRGTQAMADRDGDHVEEGEDGIAP